MIPRYALPKMSKIWTDENKFRIWFEIEANACDAQAELGVIPSEAAKIIREKGQFEIDRINEIEKEVKHDVIAFLTNLAEHIGPEARFIHQGLTSSDILDTCLSIQLLQASDILIKDIENLLAILKEKSLEYKKTICVGRSHGIHAEPTTIGLKFAGMFAEFERNLKRLKEAKIEISTCALSGAVGTYASIDPIVEEKVAKRMNLSTEPISTQVIPRDRHAFFFSTLAVIASSIERIAVEIRHLQRTEVREAEEYFDSGQKGSSAMPHKRNPILSENLTGLARMVRSYSLPALENVALWHERDISHSSVERMIGPDATITLNFALNRLSTLIDKLLIYPEKAKYNLDLLGGLVFSQRVLLALTQNGLSREDAYSLVQKNAMKVWKTGKSFKETLMEETSVREKINPKEMDNIFSYDFYLKNIDTIFDKVFNKKR
ncbi:MAG: adenylosuccinate lyase [Alphaproteobacteria bacterium TMED87]|nr:adenylosuccinate lyase [Rhodospirillaceae bacterium]OUV11362.1 MAG: adenylosuccinate lyase [Alphaproteobacteria bacterium TMED87]